MKQIIEGYEIFKVNPRWVFLKIKTKEGLFGFGEPILEGRADSVIACVKELMESYLIGKNALDINDHWNVLYRGGFYRGGPILMSALSGIDQALWDIKGKYFNVPVYELLGGKCRDKIKSYSWIGGDRPSDTGNNALDRKNKGFSAIKMNATEELQFIDSFEKIDNVLERVASIREKCGKYFSIAIDFHGRVHKPMAKILVKKLEEFDPMFIEEPVLSEHYEAFEDIAKSTYIPIATGERLFSRWDFKKLFLQNAISIIQPDASHAGGISEVIRIANMAESYDIALAPHCPLGPIALASCLHIDAVVYNAFIQEQSIGIHYNNNCDVLDYVINKEVFDFDNGYLHIPTGAGLGIEINEDKLISESKISSDWKNPIWRHKDNSFAEW